MNKNTNRLPLIVISIFFLTLVITGVIVILLVDNRPSDDTASDDYRTFESCRSLAGWLNESKKKANDPIFFNPQFELESNLDATAGSSERDFSTTNVQVAGVDEADIIKTDGEFIYTITGGLVSIVRVDESGNFELVNEIPFDERLKEMYLYGDNLVIFSTAYRDFVEEYKPRPNIEFDDNSTREFYPGNYGSQPVVNTYIYNIADRTNPVLARHTQVEGSYNSSRMIDGVTYLVTNFNTRLYDGEITSENVLNYLPKIKESQDSNYESYLNCEDIALVGDYGSQFMTMTSISVNDDNINKELLLTNAEKIYASIENMYVINSSYEVSKLVDSPCTFTGRLFSPDNCITVDPSGSHYKTNIYKFSLANNDIQFEAKAEVKGNVLNQFSMDEYDGYFRIATTIGEIWNEREPSKSSIYIFDDNMNQTGVVEGLGRGERIYSVRYIQDRAYVVTFKKVDPFYVIDLSNPSDPVTLGELKIPGYSDYLHSYDDNHIIGIGKNTVEAQTGDFAWYQGIKMALFDVSDPSNPTQKHMIEVGDRGSESEALFNHKAFLFDYNRNLLVLPVSIAEIDGREDINFPTNERIPFGNVNFRGFVVYEVTSDRGFSKLGRVEVEDANNDYWWGYGENGSRSLYIDDILVTFSDKTLRSNRLYNIIPIDSIQLSDQVLY